MSDVIAECEKYLEEFKALIGETRPFEAKGIFNSEMLMFCSMARALGAKHILESGRARGQSTEIIARMASKEGMRFDSIELDPGSADVSAAESRLGSLRQWVGMHYGDAFELIPEFIDEEPCVLLVDGPKGPLALKLALKALERKNVVAVFIHDVHRDADNIRPLMEKYFPDSYFSDEEAFVERFSGLDEECWKRQALAPECRGWRPYRRGARKMRSYSATLGFIPAEKVDDALLTKCFEEVDSLQKKEQSFLYRAARKIKRLFCERAR